MKFSFSLVPSFPCLPASPCVPVSAFLCFPVSSSTRLPHFPVPLFPRFLSSPIPRFLVSLLLRASLFLFVVLVPRFLVPFLFIISSFPCCLISSFHPLLVFLPPRFRVALFPCSPASSVPCFFWLLASSMTHLI